MEDILISIIIPAHNAASTLGHLINSVQPKSLKKIEILIIENGSQDNTFEIAQKLSKQYSCIKVIQSEMGVSAARNKGLKNAMGKWIAFADADDMFLPGAISTLAEHTNADLTLFSYESGKKNKCIDTFGQSCFKDKECEIARVRMLENPTLYMPVWSKLFSADIIQRNNLQFDTRLSFSEDSDFTMRYTKYCKSIVFSNTKIYRYDLNTSSVMRSFDGKKAEKYLEAMKISLKKIKDESDSIKHAFMKYILMHLNIIMIREVFSVNNPLKYNDKIILMKKLVNEDLFSMAISKVNFCECNSLRMLPIFLLKLKLYSFAAIIFRCKAVINLKEESKSII